jgi:hypothetical protein
MVQTDRHFGTNFFSAGGGEPVMFQHIFWFSRYATFVRHGTICGSHHRHTPSVACRAAPLSHNAYGLR